MLNKALIKRLSQSFAILLALIFVAGTQGAFAQGTRGTVRGKVTDPNAAVVPNAAVKLIDKAKNSEVRSGTTNGDGEYQFVEIEPSTYYVVVNATGFSEFKTSEFVVEPNRNVVLDAAVSVASGTPIEVQVSAGAELVDRESPTLGTTVERRR